MFAFFLESNFLKIQISGETYHIAWAQQDPPKVTFYKIQSSSIRNTFSINNTLLNICSSFTNSEHRPDFISVCFNDKCLIYTSQNFFKHIVLVWINSWCCNHIMEKSCLVFRLVVQKNVWGSTILSLQILLNQELV